MATEKVNEMYEINFSLSEQFSAMQFKTLERAAEISPKVKGCTLGPGSSTQSESKEKTATNKIIIKRPVAAASASPPKLEPRISVPVDLNSFKMCMHLREVENQRKKVTRQQLNEWQSKFVAATKLSREKQRMIYDDSTKRAEEKQQSCARLIEQEAEKRTAAQTLEINRAREMLRTQTQRQLQKIAIQGIAQIQQKFGSKYQEISKVILSADKAYLSDTDYNSQINSLIQSFDQLINKVKIGECGPAEILKANDLCISLENIEKNLIDQLLRQKQKADAEKAAVNVPAPAPAPVPAPAAIPARQEDRIVTPSSENIQNTTDVQAAVIPSTVSEGVTSSNSAVAFLQTVSAERYEFYRRINSLYQDKQEKIKILQSDEKMKKYRTSCLKIISIPVNSIAAVSQQHLQDKFDKLYNFISGHPASTAEGLISINDHPLGRDYCLLLLGKNFVSQAKSVISSSPVQAFPFATVIVSLWNLIPEFGDIFLAYIFKESPLMVPYFSPPKVGQPIEDHLKLLGYRLTEPVESATDYLKRQAGVARLYGAVIITNGGQMVGNKHPYGIENAWRWLTNFLLLEPFPEISATLIDAFLEVVGATMWATYRQQFVKLLLYIQQQYYPRLAAIDSGGPKERLQMNITRYLKEGRIPPPAGILPKGFW